MSKLPIQGLYAITDRDLIPSDRLVDIVREVIQNGARIIQYRNNGGDRNQREHEALELVKLCREYHVPLIVNDDVTIAEVIHAYGVHLGHDDMPIARARELLGESAIIGVSCYNNLERAIEAERAGADYVAFGRFFPSFTKPDAAEADLDLLRQAKKKLKIPVVAVGGITIDNCAPLIEAGADAIAVIRGLFGLPDPAGTARHFARCFEV